MTVPLNSIEKILSGTIEQTSTCEGMSHWFKQHLELTQYEEHSLLRATLGGARFRQTSFAFASAYQSAIESLFGVERSTMAALCHNEKGVLKPRDMRTRVTSSVNGTATLSGRKGFVSGGESADTLFVSAVDDRDDQARVVVIALNSATKGVKLTPLPSLPFVPELAHASAEFSEVSLRESDFLQGDGHTDYIKPFRTEEDMHILAALIGQRCNIAIELKQHGMIDQALSILMSLLGLYEQDRNSPTSHLVLAGIRQQTLEFAESQDNMLTEEMPEFVAAWQRDKALLAIAERAQTLRTEKARNHFALV